MSKIEKYLLRTRKTLHQACREMDIDIEDIDLYNIDQCSSCSIWLKHSQLRKDLDANLICKECWTAYGD